MRAPSSLFLSLLACVSPSSGSLIASRRCCSAASSSGLSSFNFRYFARDRKIESARPQTQVRRPQVLCRALPRAGGGGEGAARRAAAAVPAQAPRACTVPTTTFDTWFQSGTPSLNGVVNPANSVTFSAVPNCSFYQWSEQMFLWLTSPAPPVYGGGGGFIFDSPAFYDVSPPDSSSNRTLIPHTPGFIRAFGLRNAQLGPANSQVIVAKNGQPFKVARPLSNAPPPQVIDTTGRTRTLAHVEFGEQGARVLRDTAGAVIEPRAAPTPAVTLDAPASALVQVQQVLIDGVPIFIDPSGNVVETEQPEANGDVVMTPERRGLIRRPTPRIRTSPWPEAPGASNYHLSDQPCRPFRPRK
jgi:hypothetical protein